ncbi:hypothetical protein ILUMI_03764 [Ignelater luminosus]|uniref:Uncharacterized protein n=1 Tax=Ignelater luminosus TaxID=2038154 RepID=A0A8K0DAD3_IGNLU|nr:hypothetical protein ILUMI_03764 [Ignelater luminosus]
MGRKKNKQVVKSTCSNKCQEHSLEIKSNNIQSVKDEVSSEEQKELLEDLCSNINVISNETYNEDDQNLADKLQALESSSSHKISSPLYSTVDLDTEDVEYPSDDSTDDSIVTVIENRFSSDSSFEDDDACPPEPNKANIAKYTQYLNQPSTDEGESKLEFVAHAGNDRIRIIIDPQSNRSLLSEQSSAKEDKENLLKTVLNDQSNAISLAVENQKETDKLNVELKPLGSKRKRSRSLGDINSIKLTSNAKSFQPKERYSLKNRIRSIKKTAIIDQCTFVKVKSRISRFMREVNSQLLKLPDKSSSCATEVLSSRPARSSKRPLREPKERTCSHCLQKHNIIDTVGSTINKMYPDIKIPSSLARTKINDSLRKVILNPWAPVHKNTKKEKEGSVNPLTNSTENDDVRKITELKNHQQEHDQASSYKLSSYDKVINNENDPEKTSQKTNSDILLNDNKEQKAKYQKKHNQTINDATADKNNSNKESRDSEQQFTAINKNQQENINLPLSVGNKTNKENRNKREEPKSNQQRSNQAVSSITSTSTENNNGTIKKEIENSNQAAKSNFAVPTALTKRQWCKYFQEKYKSLQSKDNDEKPTTGHTTKVAYIPGVGPYAGLMIPEFAFMDFSHITCPEVQTSNKKKKMVELQEVLNIKQEAKAREQICNGAVQGKLEKQLKMLDRIEKDLKMTQAEIEKERLVQARMSRTLPFLDNTDETTPWFSEWKQDDDNYNVFVACNK